ncbi:MAG TPA: hypothetical protein VGF67_01220 [Ktedonobacteraceae bacterium]
MHCSDEPSCTYSYDVYHTMRQTFAEICAGQSPWIPLGKFMNHWYGDHPDERERLICDSLPENYPPAFGPWAAFCAASVEWFCHTYGVACPAWVHDSRYVLDEPWFFERDDQAVLQRTTPPEFARRNVYCGAHIYANKWEFVADLWVRYGDKLTAKGRKPDDSLLPYIEAARRQRTLPAGQPPD